MTIIAERAAVTYVRDLKTNTPCVRCNKKFHYSAMDFDHVGDDKAGGINRLMWSTSLARVKEEIAKCNVVCSSCHRIITFERTTGQTVDYP